MLWFSSYICLWMIDVLLSAYGKTVIYHISDYERDDEIHVREFRETMDNRKLAKELGKQINYKFGYTNLPSPKFEDIKEIMQENAKTSDVRKAAAFFKLIRYSYARLVITLEITSLRFS